MDRNRHLVFAAIEKKRFRSDGDRHVGWEKMGKVRLWKYDKLGK